MCNLKNTNMSKFPKQIHLSRSVLQELITTENSCVEVNRGKKHITLFPYHLKNISASIRETLEERISKYNKDLDGILLGYKNIKLLSRFGSLNNDSCFIHLDIEADFFIFRPVSGKELPAIVTRKSKNHVGCLVYHTFDVSVPKPEGVKNWPGDEVELGQEISIKVTFANLDAELPYIRGEFQNNLCEDQVKSNEKKIQILNVSSVVIKSAEESVRKKRKAVVLEETEEDIDFENSVIVVEKPISKKKRKMLDQESPLSIRDVTKIKEKKMKQKKT